MRPSVRRRFLWGIGGAVLVILVSIAGFVAWALTPMGPADVALEALRSDGAVRVTETRRSIVFEPTDEKAIAGFIMYPGGRVDARSYAPLARRIAERGYLVAIVPMRLNLAVLSPDRADEVIAAHPEIRVWGIGGHSLGGALAARYADENPDQIAALALLASYPPGSTHLEDDDTAVVSILGAKDGIVSADDVSSGFPRLPADTARIVIDGGNHAQFGAYGAQPGDNVATISATEQQAIAAEAIALLLRPVRLKAR